MMKTKKLLALLLALCLTLALAACGGEGGSANSEPAGSAASGGTEGDLLAQIQGKGK